MSTTSVIQIKCPCCGNKFSSEQAIAQDLKLHFEKEYEKKFETQSKAIGDMVRKQEEERYTKQLKAIENDRQAKAHRLAELESRSLALEEQEQRLKSQKENLELEMRKRLLDRERVIRDEAEQKASAKAEVNLREKQLELERQKENLDLMMVNAVREQTEKARSEERMKAAELQKKLDDQVRLVHEMQRKAEQGSMQAQGEVQELAIEEFLRNAFAHDDVEEILKGKRGADSIHHVKDAYGNSCGRILYESKRTKNFGSDWTVKLREDMRLQSADIGVIVTEVLPGDMDRFGLYDGVWVCTFAEFQALAVLFRDSLIRLGELRAAHENKGEKMQVMYEYLTSTEFRQRLEAIVEAFEGMRVDLNKEKTQMLASWAKREKQIYKVMSNTVTLYGELRGIAGSAVKQIDSLEIEEVKALTR